MEFFCNYIKLNCFRPINGYKKCATQVDVMSIFATHLILGDISYIFLPTTRSTTRVTNIIGRTNRRDSIIYRKGAQLRITTVNVVGIAHL